MTRQPLIGLNMSLEHADDSLGTNVFCKLDYVDSVAAAGGLPVLLPPLLWNYRRCSESNCAANSQPTWADQLEAFLRHLDGFCLIGGDDYHPGRYGGRAQRTEELLPLRRDRFDLFLAERLLAREDLPVLGICGGLQLLSLARGGALIQDLATEWIPPAEAPVAKTLPHSPRERLRSGANLADVHAWRHPVSVAPDSFLADSVKTRLIAANSYHHQAVRPERLGRGWKASAWAEDGVIEALEPDLTVAQHERIPGVTGNRWLLGVQWHPERQAQTEATHAALFGALIAAAAV
jgi:putative glutamine amidotransferase